MKRERNGWPCMLRADDEQKSELPALLEDVVAAKESLALSAFGTIVWGWGEYLGWWSFSCLLVWGWFAFRDIRRDCVRLNKSESHPSAAASDASEGR